MSAWDAVVDPRLVGLSGNAFLEMRERIEAERAVVRCGAEASTSTALEHGVRVTVVSDVVAERVRWLWPGWLPRGKLVVLDGDPGLGKSTVMLDLAARVSTGSPMPDGARLDHPGGVVVMSAEDGIADTIRPRLEAAGADLTRVVVFEAVVDRDGRERPPRLPDDLEALECVAREHDAALVIIDVLAAYLTSAVDSHRDQDVRGALMPLARLAESTGAVVIVLRHLNKSGGGSPLYRGGGSIGIIGAARAGLLVAPDPDVEGRLILVMTKSNLGAMPGALAYRLVNDPRHDSARIEWEGPTDHKAADLLAAASDGAEPSARGEAEEFLLDLLADGPVPAKQVRAEARDAGIADRTLARAKKALGVRSTKLGRPGDSCQSWGWSLPEGCRRVPQRSTAPFGILRDAPPDELDHREDGEHLRGSGPAEEVARWMA